MHLPMTFLPVVVREMAVQARRKGIYRLRMGTALVALAVVAWLVIIASANVPTASQGEGIFTVLISLSFLFSLFVGVRATSDCLSEEKREGTLGLLFLTDLKGYSIVLGKVAVGSFASISGLLGIVPVLFLAVLLGGVTFLQVAVGGVVLLNTMFLSLAAGALVSSLCRNERVAMFAAFFLMLGLIFLPFGFSLLMEGWDNPRFPEEFVWPSPIFTYIFVIDRPFPNPFQHLVIPSLAVQHVTAWLFLALAAVFVRQSINTAPTVHFQNFRSFASNHVYGTAEVRRDFRARLLDRNAFLWLAAREKIKPRYAWAVVVILAIGWLLIYRSFPRMAFDLPIVLLLLFCGHFVLKLWLTSEVCNRLIEDRRSGALELLLSTPMSVRQIARGQSLALRHVFLWPIAAMLLGELLLLIGSLNQVQQDTTRAEIYGFMIAAAGVFLVDLWALKWVALWHSLFATSMSRILLATLFRLLAVPWIFFLVIAIPLTIISGLRRQEPQSLDLLALWCCLSLGVALLLGWTSRASFFRHFRAAAAQRFDSGVKPTSSIGVWMNDLLQRFHFASALVGLIPAPFRRHWVISSIATCILLVAGLALTRQWYYRAKTEREIAVIKQEGFPTSMAAMGRFHPLVPEQENVLHILKTAGTPTVHGFPIPLVNPDPERLASLRTVLSRNQFPLRELLSITNYSRCYLDPQNDPYAWTLGALHNYSILGYLESVIAVHDRDPLRSLKALDALLHLSKVFRTAPSPGAQSVSLSQLRQFSHGLELLLRHSDLPEDRLRKMQHELTELDQPAMLEKVIAWERWQKIIVIREGTQDPVLGQVPFLAVITSIVNSAGALDKYLAGYLQQARAAMAAAELPVAQRHSAALKLPSPLENPMPQVFTPFRQGDPEFNSFINRDLEIYARMQILSTALAAWLYRQDHKRFPPNLEALVPGYLPEVPIDPFSGSPLGYFPEEHPRIFSQGPEAFAPDFYTMRQMNVGEISFSLHPPGEEPLRTPPPPASSSPEGME